MTRYFEYLARLQPNHAGLWHLLGEVEAVFGIWAVALLAFMAAYASPKAALSYLESRTFTEPAFIFAIMVIAASRPILDFSGAMLQWMARLLPLQRPIAYYLHAPVHRPFARFTHHRAGGNDAFGVAAARALFQPAGATRVQVRYTRGAVRQRVDRVNADTIRRSARSYGGRALGLGLRFHVADVRLEGRRRCTLSMLLQQLLPFVPTSCSCRRSPLRSRDSTCRGRLSGRICCS